MEYNIEQYVQPELLGLIIGLYFLGMFFKDSDIIEDRHIPLMLGGIGIVLAFLYTIAVSGFSVMAAFTGMTQGLICAGCAVYINQIIKQGRK